MLRYPQAAVRGMRYSACMGVMYGALWAVWEYPWAAGEGD